MSPTQCAVIGYNRVARTGTNTTTQRNNKSSPPEGRS